MVSSGGSERASSGELTMRTPDAGQLGTSGSIKMSTGLSGREGSGGIDVVSGSSAHFEAVKKGEAVSMVDVEALRPAGNVRLSAGTSVARKGASVSIEAGDAIVPTNLAPDGSSGGDISIRAGAGMS